MGVTAGAPAQAAPLQAFQARPADAASIAKSTRPKPRLFAFDSPTGAGIVSVGFLIVAAVFAARVRANPQVDETASNSARQRARTVQPSDSAEAHLIENADLG